MKAFMNFHSWLLLALVLIISVSTQTDAKPSSYDYGDERFDYDYYNPKSDQIDESNLRRFRRGYYYIDDDFISAVPVKSNRRQDSVAAAGGGKYQFTPLVKIKQTHTKRKKLFVPNLFG